MANSWHAVTDEMSLSVGASLGGTPSELAAAALVVAAPSLLGRALSEAAPPASPPPAAPADGFGDGRALVIVILSNAITCCVMLGMACTVTVDALKKARHHLGFLGVGLASQWLLMPAVAYAVARAFDLAPHVALTLITLGCSPGGTMSNAMVYLADGDTALSIALTACTNVLALGTMPLLLHLWVERTGAASDIRIPYDSVVLALALVLVPAALGVALRHYRPKLAKIGERIGAGTARNSARNSSARNSSARNSSARNSARNSPTRPPLSAVLGAIVILSAIVVGFAGNADVLEDRQLLPINAIGAVAAVSPIGCIFALAACALLRLARPLLPARCRGAAADAAAYPQIVAVVLETGVQNTPLALAVVQLTLADAPAELASATVVSAAWGVLVTLEAALVTAAARAWGRRKSGVRGICGCRRKPPPADVEPSALPAESRDATPAPQARASPT